MTGPVRKPADVFGLLGKRGVDISEAKLALFSAQGFDRRLAAAAGDAELIDMEGLYGGQ